MRAGSPESHLVLVSISGDVDMKYIYSIGNQAVTRLELFFHSILFFSLSLGKSYYNGIMGTVLTFAFSFPVFVLIYIL